MVPEKQMAGAVGAKTARACDICVRRRARFYCGPDDAFLCQACDDSVHSANPLARRHTRVRLKGASSADSVLPTWHRSPTRKPRTPRHRKKSIGQHHLLVPELDTSTSVEDDDDQLLYRVPVFDYDQYDSAGAGAVGCFPAPADFDLAEFEADVEAILGEGFDEEGACGISMLMQDSPAIKVEEEPSFDEPVRKKKRLLRLSYDAVISSWGEQGSPWMSGTRPEFNFDDGDDFLGLSALKEDWEVKESGRVGSGRGGDEGREARVTRYREKRRTRLFSKRIRYEVRKLNAEKRPRLKGRFVKRSSFPLHAA